MKGENERGRKTEKMDHSTAGICPDICPQFLPDSAGDQISGRRVVDSAHPVDPDTDRNHHIFHVETSKSLVKSKIKSTHNRGRPIRSDSVRVVPHFRDPMDTEKFGRALIKLTQIIAEQKNANRNITDEQPGGTYA